MQFPRGDWKTLRRYWLVVAAILGVLAAAYVAVSALHLPVLEDPFAVLAGRGTAAAAGIVGLLVADVLMPVPSSLVMAAGGALFGPVAGAALSLAGSVGGFAVAFALGRRGSRLLGRLVPPAERVAADGLLSRRGAIAILLTRPVPVLAEAVALLAGASPLSWGRALAASAVGALPGAVLCSLAGALATRLPHAALLLGAAVPAAGAFWAVDSYVQSRRPDPLTRSPRRPR
ncbi:MAG: TVP38/TMEM64 family protein [Coriobacteriia bacterium]|nr:TVP38/TMEM64 family protein [Coriobacteriia bacterium]